MEKKKKKAAGRDVRDRGELWEIVLRAARDAFSFASIAS